MILGAGRFEAMARQFLREHPAQTPVLALFGKEFPEFVACQPISREIPYLTDVAALERLWTECLFAPDAPVLDARTYAALEPAELLRLRPCVHPATRFKRFETPAVTIWEAHRAKNGFEEIEPEWKSERALVTRHGMGISVDPIDEVTHHLLLEMQRGHSLRLAIDQTAGVYPAPNLARALSTVISSGALAAPRAEGERIW